MTQDPSKKTENDPQDGGEKTNSLQEIAQIVDATEKVQHGLKIGDVARLRAVYGRLIHPHKVPLEFDTDKSAKVEIDSFLIAQLDAGKLTVED